jgi:hypothetical protein
VYKFYIADTEEFELPVTQEELSMFILSSKLSLSQFIGDHHRRIISKSQINRKQLEIHFAKWCVQICNSCPGTIVFTATAGWPDIYVSCILGEYASLSFVPSLTNHDS